MPNYDRLVTPVEKTMSLINATVTTPVTSASIDLKDVMSLAFVIMATAYTSGSLSAKIQVSDDNTNWVDLDLKYQLPETITPITAVNQIISIGLSGVDLQTQRYARFSTVGTVVMGLVAIAIVERQDR